MSNTPNQNKYIGYICLVAYILNAYAYFPGFLSPDSLEQYQQSLSGVYSDWHPPVMAIFWRLLNNFYQGPGIMLLFQLGCLWLAVFYLATSIRNRAWVILTVLFALMPFIQNFAGYIIKDSQMAMTWLLAFAMMFKALVNKRKMHVVEVVLSVLLLLYGTWVRINALPGLLPLAILWAYCVFPATGWQKKWAYGIGLTVAILVGQMLFIKVLNPGRNYAESKIFIHDLTGIYVKTGDNVFPSFLYENPKFDTGYLKQKYHTATFDNIWWNGDDKVALAANNEGISARLKTAWEAAIKKHPGIYLKNRFDGFLYFLRIKKRDDNFTCYFKWIVPNELGLAFEENFMTRVFLIPVEAQKGMPYMRPWFWFFLNISLCCLIPMVKRPAYKYSFAALSISSLFYLLPSFAVFQVDTDFRYFYWNCFACTLALLILLADRLKWAATTDTTKH